MFCICIGRGRGNPPFSDTTITMTNPETKVELWYRNHNSDEEKHLTLTVDVRLIEAQEMAVKMLPTGSVVDRVSAERVD